MKLEFRQTVTCNHLTLARVCKTIDWQQPLPRCGEYVAGLDTLDGEQELQVHKLLHGKEDTICGDSGYTGADKREELQGVEAAFWIAEKPSKLRSMKNTREPSDDSWNSPGAMRSMSLRCS